MNAVICNLIDLQSYYERKLANVGNIAEESIGRSRVVMKLFARIMARFCHHVSIGYGASTKYHRGEFQELVGIG